ncbi:MAG: methyltransferase domain-containing protein [Acidobacteriota bacterium]|nr:methyltransferase domain-containing protein [Acidobacteriota bacterium]
MLDELATRLMDAGYKAGRVLDAACGPGVLVAQFRRRGVEAFGIDSCEEALGGIPEHVRRYCRVQQLTEPLDDSYDLIVCINGLGHLADGAQSAVLRSLTAAAPALFFAETGEAADTLARRTGALHWMERFAGYGFAPSLTFSTPGFGDCAMLLRRGPAPAPEVTRLLAECLQLRAAAVRPAPAGSIELARQQERARLLEGQLMREREYLETLRGTHAFLIQEVQKLRSAHPSSDKGAAPPDMDALLVRIREELAGGIGVTAQDDVWRIVQDQTDLRAQFTRLERRMTGNERSLQQVAERVDGILRSKIWRTLVSGAAVVLRFTGRGTRG